MTIHSIYLQPQGMAVLPVCLDYVEDQVDQALKESQADLGMEDGRVHSSKIISKNEDSVRVAKGIAKLYGVSKDSC